MPLRLFCWHPPRGGVECKAVAVDALVGRVHHGLSVDQHLSLCIFVALFGSSCAYQEHKLTNNLKNARLRGSARESAPPRRTNSSQPAAGHFTSADFTHPLCAVCISLSPAARVEITTPPQPLPVYLLPACLPDHCWLCEAGRYRPVSSSSLLLPFSVITLNHTPALPRPLICDGGCADEETQT